MEKKTENIMFSVVDYEKPVKPSIEEVVGNGKSIVNWGTDNQYPQHLIDYYNDSVTMHACIDRITDYIVGDGVIMSDDIAQWEEKVNGRGEQMMDLIKQLAHDYIMYGGFAIQIVYSKLQTKVELYALDFAKCRTNEDHSIIRYNRKWGKYTEKGNEYAAFGTAAVDDAYTQVYYYNGGRRTVYPIPTYHGALNAILTEAEAGRYALNTLANGFACRYMIEFIGGMELPESQKKALEKGIKEKFTGSDAQNFMLYWGASDTESMKVSKIENDTETVEKYNAIEKSSRSSILAAFGMSPLLLGLTDGLSTGFSTQEFSDTFKLYQRTFIAPMQKQIERSLMSIIGGTIKIKPFNINFTEDTANE